MGRLITTASTEREEMIGPSANAGRMGSLPIDQEPAVDVVCAFGCLDIREIDPLARQLRPGDVPLVVRYIDPLR